MPARARREQRHAGRAGGGRRRRGGAASTGSSVQTVSVAVRTRGRRAPARARDRTFLAGLSSALYVPSPRVRTRASVRKRPKGWSSASMRTRRPPARRHARHHAGQARALAEHEASCARRAASGADRGPRGSRPRRRDPSRPRGAAGTASAPRRRRRRRRPPAAGRSRRRRCRTPRGGRRPARRSARCRRSPDRRMPVGVGPDRRGRRTMPACRCRGRARPGPRARRCRSRRRPCRRARRP